MSRLENPVAQATPLEQLGRKYTDAQGAELWAVHDLRGNLVEDGLQSEWEAKHVASQVICENQ